MASTRLTKTFSGSGTSNKIMTFSFWCKKTIQSGWSYIIHNGQSDGDPVCVIGFEDNFLKFNYYVGGSTLGRLKTNRLFRDTSAWYHVVVAIDTTQATSSNRIKFYVNGVQETSFSQSDYPSLNQTITLLQGTDVHTIGASAVPDGYFDGQMTHFHAIDGTAYDADTFGETDATTGIWKPKTAPSVTYGTNGFFLKFASSGSMGTDSSGNGNDFTVNGTLTQTQDTPSNVFATLNPLDNYYAGSTFSNGNCKISTLDTSHGFNISTLGASTGKYYMEAKLIQGTSSNFAVVGISDLGQDASLSELGEDAYEYAYVQGSGNIRTSAIGTSYGATYTTNDIIGVAMDLDNNKLYVSKNGTWQNSADPSAGTGGFTITAPSNTDSGVYHFAVGDWQNTAGSNGVAIWEANFGNGYFGTTAVSSAQSPSDGIGLFEYAVPSGYKALCTKSINSQEYS